MGGSGYPDKLCRLITTVEIIITNYWVTIFWLVSKINLYFHQRTQWIIYANKCVCLLADRRFCALLPDPADYIQCKVNYWEWTMAAWYWNPSTGCFKKCPKHLIFRLRNHTAGSCAYMRTTTITPHLSTSLYHYIRSILRIRLWSLNIPLRRHLG